MAKTFYAAPWAYLVIYAVDIAKEITALPPPISMAFLSLSKRAATIRCCYGCVGHTEH